jgi:hypothetical protein
LERSIFSVCDDKRFFRSLTVAVAAIGFAILSACGGGGNHGGNESALSVGPSAALPSSLTASPLSPSNQSAAPGPHASPKTTPAQPVIWHLIVTGSQDHIQIDGTPREALCSATAYVTPDRKRAVLLAPARHSTLQSQGTWSVIWNSPPDHIDVVASPSPTGSPRGSLQTLVLKWWVRCSLGTSDSSWVQQAGTFDYTPAA